MALKVGDFVREKGFVTRLIGVINRDAAYLERALGFRAGRLGQGWMLLALKEAVQPEEFAFAGYSHLSGGEAAAATPSGIPLKARIEALSRAASTSADARLGTGHDLAKRQTAESFVLEGANRIVKIVPAMPHMAAIPPDEQYPPGAGLPQWVLLAPKLFVVAAIVGRGSHHSGGGAGNHPLPSHWVDPTLAKTA
ncbi:hypothetical protein [Paracraurococcus lichenis]|uniref:Uncharacterized protein n=1 Tax=Paracraurococcus lichenis TaxID=3064888 RepID=A0ABT9E5Q8_9PROT|nr:hypothetical protein [Paracraurococcus sp. LOR1-02]MDO9711330.1 hypothetical protein [Paracraurococcus sp. LOR1-02]